MAIDISMKDTPPKEVLLTMLRFALIETRASDDIQFSKSLADIFHNLPAQLLGPWTEEINLRAYSQIVGKAERYNLGDFTRNLQKSAESSVEALSKE